MLDEPTNGLDPAGIRDIRSLVRDLGRSGVTVLLSSHNLVEVQQVCDSVSIIGGGALLSSGTVEDLVGRERPGGVRVGVADPDAALEACYTLEMNEFRGSRTLQLRLMDLRWQE